MPRRLALLLRVSRAAGSTGGVLHVTNVETESELVLKPGSFLFTLECEPGDSVARGHLQWHPGGLRHAVQGDVGLFDALRSLIGHS